MNTKLSVLFAAASMLAGCSGDSDKSGTASGTNSSSGGGVATAPVDYLRNAAQSKQSADKTIDTTSLNKAIQLFNVEKGRNPTDLEELARERFIPYVPTPPFGTRLDYDSQAGTVSVVKQ